MCVHATKWSLFGPCLAIRYVLPGNTEACWYCCSEWCPDSRRRRVPRRDESIVHGRGAGGTSACDAPSPCFVVDHCATIHSAVTPADQYWHTFPESERGKMEMYLKWRITLNILHVYGLQSMTIFLPRDAILARYMLWPPRSLPSKPNVQHLSVDRVALYWKLCCERTSLFEKTY